MTIPQGTPAEAVYSPGSWLLVRCGCGGQIVQVVEPLEPGRLRVRRWLHSRRRFTRKPGTARVVDVMCLADQLAEEKYRDDRRWFIWYIDALRCRYQAAIHDDRQRRFF